MKQQYRLTARGMILQLLCAEPGLFYCARELQHMVYEKYECRIKLQTIATAIEELNQYSSNIETKTQRLGPLKLPTKLFAFKPQKI